MILKRKFYYLGKATLPNSMPSMVTGMFLFYWMRLITGLKIMDAGCDARALKRRVLEKVNI